MSTQVTVASAEEQPLRTWAIDVVEPVEMDVGAEAHLLRCDEKAAKGAE
jgi:hypothetical protein